ncbi:MAG: IS982 family transposase [Acidobacteria bacterium]|nr:IS982 family transposase [Acidobacteriota bacterium]
MNAEWIITVFVILDELLTKGGHHDHQLSQVGDSEVLTVAVVAAKYFQNHHERALLMMRECKYLSGTLSVSRFNRRLHMCREWLEVATEVLCEVATSGEVFIIDSLPVPVCKRVRARRCRKVRGLDYCGYCSAKKEKFFGYRLHLICNETGAPVSYELLAARFHDLTPVHDLAFVLPPAAKLFGDKGYISEEDAHSIEVETGVRVIAARRKNMEPLAWIDEYELKQYRKGIETRNSQVEKMGIERLYARTNLGFEIKVHASMFALSITTLN